MAGLCLHSGREIFGPAVPLLGRCLPPAGKPGVGHSAGQRFRAEEDLENEK